MENFWSTLKTELVVDAQWADEAEANNALFSYIDCWYNQHRIQKRLGWRSPDEYERAYWAGELTPTDQAAAEGAS